MTDYQPPVLPVLLVEDDEATALLERRALTRAGMAVMAASNIHDAVELLREQAFSVVLLDHRLPDGDSWPVVNAAQAKVPPVPVILVTGMGSERIAVEALQHGVADYVKKDETFFEQLPLLVKRVARLAEAEDELRRTSALFGLIENTALEVITVSNGDGRIRYISPACRRMFGYEPEELIGTLSSEMVHPEDQARTILARGHAGSSEHILASYRCRRKDGVYIWLEVSAKVTAQSDGLVTEVVGLARDVTERNRAFEQFRLATEAAPVAMIMVDWAGQIVLVNAQVEELFGYPRDELLGRSVDMLVPARLRNFETQPGASVFAAIGARVMGQGRELLGLRKDGHERPIEIGTSPLTTPDGDFVICAVVDTTARKQAEAARIRSEDKFRTLVSQAPVAIFETDADGSCTFVNAHWSELTGFSYAEALGLGWRDALHPEDRERVISVWTDSMRNGSRFRLEFRYLSRQGKVVWGLVTAVALTDPDGKVSGYLGTVVDITDRAHATEVLERSLAEKEVLLKEIHHRVKNNLQVIASLINLQARRVADPGARALFEDTRSRVHAIALLHERLYSTQDLAQIDVADYLGGLVHQVARANRDEARIIDVRVDAAPMHFDIDTAVPVGLIVNELVTNAFKHAFPIGQRSRGSILVEVRNALGRNTIVVEDDGVGFPDSLDLKQTSSLGMLLISSLSRQLEGELAIERCQGTRCVVTFPDSAKAEA